MRYQNWSDILTLLSMMVLADEKVYQEEVEVFKKAAVELRDLISPDVMLTKQMAFDWFNLHREDLVFKMKRNDGDSLLKETLDGLQEMPDKKKFMFALMKIALADGHEHGAESRMINLASKHWDIDLKIAS